jgi:hypothetical protein
MTDLIVSHVRKSCTETDIDCDGLIDTSDSDCDTPPVYIATEDPEVPSDDGIDDDCNEVIDCDDTHCSQDPVCQTGMACADYGTKGDCNGDPAYIWEGSPQNGICGPVWTDITAGMRGSICSPFFYL